MPRFRLVVRDAAGKVRTSTVSAASEDAAADIARRKGYAVDRVEPVHDLDDTPAPEPLPADDAPPPPRRSASRVAVLPLAAVVLAGLALLVSVFTFGYVVWTDPLGGGLGRYDLSSPRATYLSRMQMEQKVDLRAELELRRRFGERTPSGRRLAEKIASYELRKEIDYGSRKGLLVTYKVGGEKRHEVEWFEKDDKTGWWLETDIPMTDIEKQDRELADQLRRFLSSGELPSAKK